MEKCINKKNIKNNKPIKIININDRIEPYYFLKNFDFKEKNIISAYRFLTNDFSINSYDKERIEKLIRWYNENSEILYDIKFAATFYYLFITIKPFIHNNQYMALVLMNTILYNQGHPPIVIPLEKRLEFLYCKERLCLTKIEELIKDVLKHSLYKNMFIKVNTNDGVKVIIKTI